MILLILACISQALAQSCPSALTPAASPVIADGYSFQVIANGLTSPRGITFDSAGNLLVVQQYGGIVNLALTDNGGACLSVASKVALDLGDIDISLNHGITLSPDGGTLYASTNGSVYTWPYDASTRSVLSTNYTQIIRGMENTDHVTRTLHYSTTNGDNLLVSRGSAANVDPDAGSLDTGHSQVRAFDLSSIPGDTAGYDFTTEGVLLGWGLRNSVGVTEHPDTGGIWTVENSMDNVLRGEDQVDIHLNNPGEEMNYLGTVAEPRAANHGYPYCVSAWAVDEVNDNTELDVGTQFAVAMNELNGDVRDDAYCVEEAVAPRLVFAAHTAPLDLKFNGSDEAWVSFHGSWNRDPPDGYRLARIEFADGEPVEPSTSRTAETDILTNADLTVCPGACFRPVGIAFDAQGRLFLSSDATGEIYVVVKN